MFEIKLSVYFTAFKFIWISILPHLLSLTNEHQFISSLRQFNNNLQISEEISWPYCLSSQKDMLK